VARPLVPPRSVSHSATWKRSSSSGRREVGVHAVDLFAEVDFADLPDDFLIALIDDVIVKRTANGELAIIAAWLTGRANSHAHLGAWL